MKKILLLSGLTFAFFGCSNEPISNADRQDSNSELLASAVVSYAHLAEVSSVTGTKYTEATIATQAAYNRFRNSLTKIDAISIVAEVDHQQNAKSVGLDLEPTRVIFFGNPNLGTPLMQRNQLAGLDLPQKVLFYRDSDKNDFALYNSTEYLSSRHGLDGVATLNQISMALNNLVSNATKSEVVAAANQTVAEGEGIISKESTQTFDDTYNTLRGAISNNPNLRIIAELDHQANAARVDLELNPTKIIIFGNPNLGTPLMQDNRTVALDLPQKMLVWEDADGTVRVSYNDPDYLKMRHDLDMSDDQLATIAMALNNLSNAAAGL